jgi:sugar lactone lactonase YvrE
MNVLYKNIGLFLSVCVSITTVNGFCAQKDSVFQSYNLLTTIAGKGGAGDGVVNCWDPSFEGKPAIDAALSGPHMAMADSAGNVYIADKDAHAIRKVDRSGIITTVAGVNKSGDGKDGKATQQALNSPNGLWVTKKGELYILDLGNNKIRKVDLAGNMKTLYKDNSGIVGGRGLWVNKTEDTIWYSNMTAVKKWTAAEGAVVYADGFNDLGNICRDRNGNIIATDRGANMVYRLSTTGTKTAIAGNGQEKGVSNGRPALEIALYGVRGVWFLEDNSYFLALHEGSQVWYVDLSLIHI